MQVKSKSFACRKEGFSHVNVPMRGLRRRSQVGHRCLHTALASRNDLTDSQAVGYNPLQADDCEVLIGDENSALDTRR